VKGHKGSQIIARANAITSEEQEALEAEEDEFTCPKKGYIC
jgi:hypothetical protein